MQMQFTVPESCFIIEYICYDDLRKYARNCKRKDISQTAQFLSQVEIVIDKMHMAEHVDKWCRDNCDPNKLSDLDKVKLVMSYHVLQCSLQVTQRYVSKPSVGCQGMPE